MADPITDRRRAERFAQLLDEANGSRRHRARSRVDLELAKLVTVSVRLRSAHPVVEPDTNFRADLRARLLATAEREGIGVTAIESAGTAPTRPGRRVPRVNARHARARAALVIGIAAGTVAVSGISAASENALPGDPLYGMKRSTERAQLVLTGSELSRGHLFLEFARNRLAEAEAVRADSVGYAAVLDDMDADTRQGVRLLTTAATQRRDQQALDSLDSFAARQRRQLDDLLTRMPGPDRERTQLSLGLLDEIQRRVAALTAGLACGAEPSIRTDTLGPLPRTCGSERQPAASPSPAATQRPSSRPSGHPQPKPPAPAASGAAASAPAATGAAIAPAEAPSAGGRINVAPPQPAAPSNR